MAGVNAMRDLPVVPASKTAATLAAIIFVISLAATAGAQPPPPELTQPVNDFANVIDADSERALDSLIRSLQRASGDVVVVATVDTFQPYGTIDEYAVKMFENRGHGLGGGKDNGVLIVAAIKDRRMKVEVGYDLEQFITDGFAGETIRQYIAPPFANGQYGAGLLAGASRIISRIADARNVTLQGVRPTRQRQRTSSGSGGGWLGALFVFFIVINAIAGRLRGRRRFYRRGGWGGGPWSGWGSGVGPFGGGFGGFGGGGGGGGGFGGGGFGGGFGGFGGGRSGGGGASGGW
jgi:uncharacterized protein